MEPISMFIDRLTPEERRPFLSVAYRLLAVDGVTEDELAALSMLTTQAGIGQEWSPDTTTPLDDLLSVIKSPMARRATMMELIGLAYADLTFGPEERAFIKHAADLMALSVTETAQMENWVLQQLNLARQAELLLRGR